MNTNNELIAAIESAASRGAGVKTIRKQKHAPSQFYMTLTNGKQFGPVKCEGDLDVLNAKFDEAQAFLNAQKTGPTKSRVAA